MTVISIANRNGWTDVMLYHVSYFLYHASYATQLYGTLNVTSFFYAIRHCSTMGCYALLYKARQCDITISCVILHYDVLHAMLFCYGLLFCKAMLPCYATEHSDVLYYTDILLYRHPMRCRVTLCYVLQCDSVQFMLLLQYTVTCNAVLLCFMGLFVPLFVLYVSFWCMLLYVNK